MNRNAGFTLIELLITLLVATIVMVWGVPSFQDVMRNNRLTSQTNELLGSLNLARSEAIKRGATVSVCKSKNGTQCNNSATCSTGGASGSVSWSDGWIVFVNNASGSGTDVKCVDTNEQIIQVHGALPENFTLNPNSNFTNYISYKTDGSSNTLGTFAFCYDNKTNVAKTVAVSQSGRARVGTDTNGNGIPEKEDGTEITSCTSP